MKIAHLETGRHLYGGPQQVLQLMNAMRDRGHDNTLVAAADSELLAHAGLAGHELVALPLAGEHDLAFAVRLWRRLAADRPDLLHVHSRRGADTFGAIASRRLGLPAIVTRRVDNPLARIDAQLRFSTYRAVIAISDAVVAALEHAGVARTRITLIKDAIDCAPLVLAPERDWFLDEFGLPPRAPCLGVIAQFIPRKGHDRLLEALPAVLDVHPNTRVLFFGRGPLEDELRAQVAQAGLAARVVFAGFRTDLDKILPCLDAVIHPALAEGMGVALLEAAAAAVPVVAFDAGGIREVVDDGVTGLLAPVGDVTVLAAAINELLDDPARARELGIAARRRVEAGFTLAEHAEQHLALYRQVLGDEENAT